MEAVVSDILRARMREPGGLGQTAVLSLAMHALALTTIAMVPAIWPVRHMPPPVVMTISLGGTPGPKTGGITQLGGRNIVATEPAGLDTTTSSLGGIVGRQRVDALPLNGRNVFQLAQLEIGVVTAPGSRGAGSRPRRRRRASRR